MLPQDDDSMRTLQPMNHRPGKRPGISAIAARAGVSKATIDRVMNERPGVQPHTRKHVLAVVAQMTGNDAAGPVRQSRRRVVLDFIIPDRDNAFLADLANRLQLEADRRGDAIVRIHRPAAADEQEMLATLSDLETETEALGIVGIDSHKLRQLIVSLTSRNVPVVTLASDIRNVPRTAYVGIDNTAAGRLAGYLAGRMIARPSGNTALILGSRAYFGHEEREMGYRNVMREAFPKMRIIDEREVHEEPERAYREVRTLLDERPGLDGLYCIGAGQAGVAQALIDAGRDRSVFFVGHGLSADTRRFLINGAMDIVIDENAAAEAAAAIATLTDRLNGRDLGATPVIPLRPIFRENLPLET